MLKQSGSSLLELMVAALLGLLVMLTLQQTWAWQQDQQRHHVTHTRSILAAQSLMQQLTSDLAHTDATKLDVSGHCYLLPQTTGRLIAYRLHNQQLQRHTLAPHCPASGWQSLSHYASLAIEELDVNIRPSKEQPSTLVIRLLARGYNQYHALSRTLTLESNQQ